MIGQAVFTLSFLSLVVWVMELFYKYLNLYPLAVLFERSRVRQYKCGRSYPSRRVLALIIITAIVGVALARRGI